jgi:hypothetical protein
MHTDVHAMASQFRRLSIENAFPRVHHFSSGRFVKGPPTLTRFITYCESVADFQDGENPQTLRRALAVCTNLSGGFSLDEAITEAWRAFPLVTR